MLHNVVGRLLEFLQSVSRQVEVDVVQRIAYFSLMTDESTDVSVLKQLVLVARYILPTEDVASY